MTAREPSAVPGRNPFRPDDGTCGRSFRSGSGYYRDCVLPPHGPEVRHSAIGPASPAREPRGRYLPCPVCGGETAHHRDCSVPVLGPPRDVTCRCAEAEVDQGVCIRCGLPFQVGGSV